jgi:hypothetical protein
LPEPAGEVFILGQVLGTVGFPSLPELGAAELPQPIDNDDLDMDLFGPDGLDFEEECGVSTDGDGGPENALQETELEGAEGETPLTPPFNVIGWDTWGREWDPQQLSDHSKNVDHSPARPLSAEGDFDWPWSSPLLHPSQPMDGPSAPIPLLNGHGAGAEQ